MIAVPAFVVIGGGADGVYYVRQLRRAVAAGRLACPRVVVVDRKPDCAVATLSRVGAPALELAVADWDAWLADALDLLPADSHLVPWHWAPHLLQHYLATHVARAGGRAARVGGLPAVGTPYDRETREGDRALSYATWTCPPTCIEPALCPHTRGPKDWSLAGRLATPEANSLVFPCLHLIWGVGTIPVAAIRAARDRVLARLRERPEPALWHVGTASHCHGLQAGLEVSRPA
ncbi:MAG: hypothetical protein NDJ94_17670 [Vicinamibacteria bacterium]|nr:hypothetical protein [Vicinamibacteria bacterium]